MVYSSNKGELLYCLFVCRLVFYLLVCFSLQTLRRIMIALNLGEEVFILGEEYNSTPAVVVHY